MAEDHRLPLTEAARALHWTYWKSRDALLTGRLRGGRDTDGRFWVEVASVNELLAERVTAIRSPGPDQPNAA